MADPLIKDTVERASVIVHCKTMRLSTVLSTMFLHLFVDQREKS